MGTPTPKYRTVMLVDDSGVDNLMHEQMMKRYGFAECIFTHSGAGSAIAFLRNIEKLESFREEILPSLIFLDIDMPFVNGFQFLQDFEGLSALVKRLSRVVVLSSSPHQEHAEKALGYACVKEYVEKPLTKEKLSLL